jgi:NAD(P)-dependent dehydrogenase (short-subunit alcohol dehydrogenase family)
MNLDFHTHVALTFELIPALKAARGRVVNVTSMNNFIALPMNTAYVSSKHALEAYSDVPCCKMLPWGTKAVVIQPAAMRTPLWILFADGWLTIHTVSFLDIQATYGNVWAESRHTQLWENLEIIAADPDETVTVLMNSL